MPKLRHQSPAKVLAVDEWECEGAIPDHCRQNSSPEKFPTRAGEKGIADGRLHSFRHYFASMCANQSVPERVTMEWLGHADSDMVRHYYHLHDDEAQRQMRRLDLLGEAGQQRRQPGKRPHDRLIAAGLSQ